MIKMYKDGYRGKIIEFETRSIDEFGDVKNINHFETKKEAINFAKKILKNEKAVVVEKHTSFFPSYLFPERNLFETIFSDGDNSALTEGGWI